MPMMTGPETNDRYLSLRLSTAEREAFLAITQQLKTTRSRLLRKIVRELIGQGPDLLAQDLDTMDNAAYQLGCLGRNLNQLLRTIYTGQAKASIDQQALIGQLRDRVEFLHDEFTKVIDRSCERWVVEEQQAA